MTKLKTFFDSVCYEAISFVILASSVIVNIDSYVEPWDIYPYVGDYSHGIADKFLTGEILSWFTDYMPVDRVFKIAVPFALLLCAILAFFSGQVIRHTDSENKTAVTVTVFMLWLLPSGIGGLIRFIGVPDVFMALTTVLCVVMSKNRFASFAVPLISAVAVGFHQAYTLMYFPTVFVAVYYFALCRKRPSVQITTAFLTAVTTFASFIFITFFANRYLTFKDQYELIEYLNSKSDIDFNWDFLPWLFEGQYFSGLKTYTDGVEKLSLDFYQIMQVFFALLPIFAIIFFVYITAMRHTGDKKKKLLFMLCSLSWLPTFATCFAMRNVFRILSAMWMTQFIISGLFLYFKDADFLAAFNRIKSFIIKYRLAAIVYFLFILLHRKWI